MESRFFGGCDSQKMTTNNELDHFRQWVDGLSHDDLLHVMEFEIMEDEYELLKEMVQLQAPPPTPIHPGILGYRPASAAGVNDGRNEEERIYKARFERPRMFQLIETTTTTEAMSRLQNGRSRRRIVMPSKRRYEVIARKKVTPWGDVLSIGCTQEQRNADKMMLKGTRIHHGVEMGKNYCAFCCSSQDALRILFVASRGKLLSMPLSSTSPPFCAPWMNAKFEWFSLSMFLASRFEVALWESFRHERDQPFVSWSDPIQGAVEKLNVRAFQNALLSSIVKVLMKEILPNDATLRLIRDGVLWNFLDSTLSDNDTDQRIDTLSSVATVAILHLDSFQHKFQTALWSRLLEAIAVESEKEILRSLENETVSATVSTPKRKKGKNKKKKRRGRESKSLLSGAENESVSGLESTSIIKRASTASEPKMPLTDAHSIENAKVNTRKIIMAGLIVDDVLEGVFSKLGLNDPPPKEGDGNDVVLDSDEKRRRPEPLLMKDKTDEANVHFLKPHSFHQVDSDSNNEVTRNPSFDEGKAVAGPSQIRTDDNSMFPRLPQLNPQNDELPLLSEEEAGPSLPEQDFHLESDFFSVPWMFDETVDDWEKLRRYPNREKSLLADLFLSQKKDGDSYAHMASSTAASIASSSDKGGESSDNDSVGESEREIVDNEEAPSGLTTPIAPVLEEAVLEAVAASINEAAQDDVPLHLQTLVTNERNPEAFVQSSGMEKEHVEQEKVGNGRLDEVKGSVDDCRSPSPHAPNTPSPQLSPILVSLADLQTIRTRAAPENVESPKALSFSAVTAESLPSSPRPASSVTITPSWSREDLRIHSFTDDQHLHIRKRGFTLRKRASAPLSYRNAAAKSIPKSRVSSGGQFVEAARSEGRSDVRSSLSIPDSRPSVSSRNESEPCAQSETAVEVLSYKVPLNDTVGPISRNNTEVTISTKEDSPTKSPPRGQALIEELAYLRDERNAFRDMCLTLGAEVAKLKNQLAAQSGSSSNAGQLIMNQSSYHPEFAPSYFHGVPKATTTVGAMSDAGTHRGDHDSAFSEDGTDGFGHDASGRPRAVHVRRMSSGATIAGSDLSVEQNDPGQAMIGASSFRSLSRDVLGSISGHGMSSRLTKDVLNFLRAKSSALKAQDKKKTAAIERLTRLVTALWPRAQVKIYGSHVTGLCLPSSDLDFVICLPAVHKNAPAVAPGALEGRNAINESSQKTLARRLKGESWIDPRSIKIISRTIVPVIKVSTKDTRARTIQLDISFDGPEHHGLAANQMITDIMNELPMVQSLVLVLKQFLKDRSLLTAYTGGLSSYGLFLMVTRYLQEHPSSWGDCGSLLMGFLDFYGNAFDPRTTGISVARRQYFARMNYMQPQSMWDVGYAQQLAPSPSSSVCGRPDLIRRNSFNENATMDGHRFTMSSSVTTSHASRPPRFQPSSHHRILHQYKHPSEQAAQTAFDQAGRPYTFDPLFIEDPLSEANNVGRNAFRIFQVQRAFSDAHRALVASLEWDIHSSQDARDGGEYPLLNCLLQSEDVFYELDDAR